MTHTHDDKARELLPCPFCAGADIFIEPDERGSGGQWVSPIHVGCAACKAEQIADDKEAAIDAWNRRAALSAARELPPLPEPLRHVWPETDDCCFPCHYTPSGPGGIYGPARADGLRSFPIYTAQQMQDYAISALSPASSTGQEAVHFYRQRGSDEWVECSATSAESLRSIGAFEFRTLFAAPAQQVAAEKPVFIGIDYASDYLAEIRDKALEEAAEAVKDHNREGREWVPGSLWDTLSNEAAARIRSLKSAAGSNNGEGERG